MRRRVLPSCARVNAPLDVRALVMCILCHPLFKYVIKIVHVCGSLTNVYTLYQDNTTTRVDVGPISIRRLRRRLDIGPTADLVVVLAVYMSVR